MSIYFIDVHDGEHGTIDVEGADHASVLAAKKEMIQTLAQMAKDRLTIEDQREFTGQVRDSSGQEVCAATISLRGGCIG